MAYNVFGNPITDETLKGMPEYANKKPTRTDRARVALNMKNSANKDANARQYVENMKKEWGTGVCTLCLVYNATGDPVEFLTSHDYHGHLGPAPYPVVIANGQWGGFLHVKTESATSGSCAAVAYGGKNEAGNNCGWLLAWSNPWNTAAYDNKMSISSASGSTSDHLKNKCKWTAYQPSPNNFEVWVNTCNFKANNF